MPKLFSQNKKILFLIGLALFLSLTLFHFALAVDCNTLECHIIGCNADCCIANQLPGACPKDCSKVTCDTLTPPTCDVGQACCSVSTSDPTKCVLDCNKFPCSDYNQLQQSCSNLSPCCEWKTETINGTPYTSCEAAVSGGGTNEYCDEFKNQPDCEKTNVCAWYKSFPAHPLGICIPLQGAEKWCPGCSSSPLGWPRCIVCFVEYIGSLPMRLFFFGLVIFIALVALVTGLLYSLTVAICTWMIGISLEVGITPGNPMTPGVVNIGWTFTRDFVDMFFILILAFIGLATILKLKEYEAKKLLPKLIIIALLINFTPVIVGFIVDVGNIFTKFFLDKTGEIATFSDTMKLVWNYFSKSFTDVLFKLNGDFFGNFIKNLGAFIGIIIYGVVVIIFFLLGSWIYFLVELAFFLRIVELWILMILCPIAFFSHIFPKGNVIEKLFPSILHWDKWWEEFLQWIIWGIPMGFFLYLSNWVMKNTPVIETTFKQALLQQKLQGVTGFGAGLNAQFISLVTSILAPTVALVLLYKGYKIAKETAPAAAKAMIEGLAKVGQIAAAVGITAITMGAGAGAAAGLLGKASAGAQRLEAFTGKAGWTTKGGKRIEPFRYLLGKPISTTTKGVEMALAPGLLRYAAKTRRVPEKELDEMKNMAPKEAEAYTNAKTSLLPPSIRKLWRSQYMARIADDDKLKYTSKEFKDEAKDIRKSIFEKENPYFQESANTLRKALGDMGEEEEVHMHLVGLIGTDRDEKEKEIREEIKNTREITQKRLGDEGIIIEAGLKLKYITKEEVDKDKVKAVMDAKAKLTAEEITQVLSNTAAAATDVKELKPEDIKKMIDPDKLATRIGLTLGNPRNLQKIQDNFGVKKLKAVIEGTGGLNSATNTPEKLDEFAKVNPAMVRAILTSPAYREIDIEARKHMTDALDQPTSNFSDVERRGRVQELTENKPHLQAARGFLKNINIISKDLVKAKAQKSPDTEIKRIKDNLQALKDAFDNAKDGIKNPEEKRLWEELERLMQSGKKNK